MPGLAVVGAVVALALGYVLFKGASDSGGFTFPGNPDATRQGKDSVGGGLNAPSSVNSRSTATLVPIQKRSGILSVPKSTPHTYIPLSGTYQTPVTKLPFPSIIPQIGGRGVAK